MTTQLTFQDRLVMALEAMKRLEKSAENKFAKYNYVPVDDVKDLIRPALVKAGLFLSVDEDAFELIELRGSKGDTTCARITYVISLSDGDQRIENKITVVLPYTGAQTSGAARSYAVKEWAKGTLLVSTGEEAADADSHEQGQYGGRKPASATQSTAAPVLPQKMLLKTAEETRDRLCKQIDVCTTSDELDIEIKMAGFKRDLSDLARDWPDLSNEVVTFGKVKRQELVEAANSEMFPAD